MKKLLILVFTSFITSQALAMSMAPGPRVLALPAEIQTAMYEAIKITMQREIGTLQCRDGTIPVTFKQLKRTKNLYNQFYQNPQEKLILNDVTIAQAQLYFNDSPSNNLNDIVESYRIGKQYGASSKELKWLARFISVAELDYSQYAYLTAAINKDKKLPNNHSLKLKPKTIHQLLKKTAPCDTNKFFTLNPDKKNVTLDFSFKKLTSLEGIEEIDVPQDYVITKIDLRDNKLRDITILKDSTKQFPFLKQIKLNNNNVRSFDLRNIPNGTMVDLENNPIMSMISDCHLESLERNYTLYLSIKKLNKQNIEYLQNYFVISQTGEHVCITPRKYVKQNQDPEILKLPDLSIFLTMLSTQ